MKFVPPPVIGWVFTSSHPYRPTNQTPEDKIETVRKLLRSDTTFRNMLNQNSDRWVVSVALGADNIHMAIFSREDITQALITENVPLIGHENDVMFEVDSFGNLTYINHEQRAAVLRARPFTRGARSLNEREKAMVLLAESERPAPLTTV